MAKKFRIPAPSLNWSNRETRGSADYYDYSIKVGPKCWKGIITTLVHEFAHFLSYQRLNCICSPRPHNRQFVDALWDVAAAWYGDPAHYDWEREYPSVRALGLKRLKIFNVSKRS